jgi:hypothetical protein
LFALLLITVSYALVQLILAPEFVVRLVLVLFCTHSELLEFSGVLNTHVLCWRDYLGFSSEMVMLLLIVLEFAHEFFFFH